MTTSYDENKRANVGAWEKTRNLIGLVVIAVLFYEMGLAHARSEKRIDEYATLRAQYDRIETQYTALKGQYDRQDAQYSALKAQYDRIEGQRSKTGLNEPKK